MLETENGASSSAEATKGGVSMMERALLESILVMQMAQLT
ncbi:MAG: hypothetical protein Ct9H90mP7_3900 [Candidatus Neomarinimicrobiota bacterium]|nr:MAG: hypothetical protein Ct9H90mP7_3900 [Candidatus Neomarinimicrobiota bacterium]